MRKFRRLPEDERPAPAKGSKLAEALQVPAGAVSVLPRMEFCGNREVTIDGSKGVLEYDENLIRINMGKMVACFFGRNLNIKCFNLESLVIEGYITSLECLAEKAGSRLNASEAGPLGAPHR